MDIKPITREEMYLAKAAGQDVSPPEPITRKEMFFAKMAGMEVETPSTFTRLERFANKVAVALNRSVIEPLEITENGTYTAPDGVDGYNPVMVNVDPTKITILREQQFDGFAWDESFGAYSPGFVSPAEFVLKSRETYHVIWDGAEYECTAFAFDFSEMSMVAIGNGTSMGLPGNDEPFLITYNIPGNGTQLFAIDNSDSHTVGIWQKAESGGGSLPAGVYLSASFANQHVNYPNRRFVLNGELYATNSGYLSGGYLSYIYKWNGSAWSSLLSSSSSTSGLNGTTIDSVDYAIVEFNGKIHFFNSRNHATFDGTSFVNLNKLPYSTSGGMICCVYKNKLVVYMYSSGKLFEWNESGDTWTEMAQFTTSSYDYYNIFVVNDVLYAEESKIVYRYNNGALEQYGTVNNSMTYGIVRNNKVYSCDNQTYYSELHEYDPITNDNKKWTLPSFLTTYFTYGGDEFSFIGNTGSASSGTFKFPCFVIHEVTE